MIWSAVSVILPSPVRCWRSGCCARTFCGLDKEIPSRIDPGVSKKSDLLGRIVVQRLQHRAHSLCAQAADTNIDHTALARTNTLAAAARSKAVCSTDLLRAYFGAKNELYQILKRETHWAFSNQR